MSTIINANNPKNEEEQAIIDLIESTIDIFLENEEKENGRL